MADKLLTTRELEDRLQLDRVTIYRMVKDGELPALRVGGQWRFSSDAIDAWLSKQGGESAPGPVSSDASAGPEALSLTDLLPAKTLESIQEQFAYVLGVASFTIDLDGHPVIPCSRCSRYCQMIHSTEAGWAACEASWREIAHSGEEKAALHVCHAGIEYATAPIVVEGRRIGMVTAGQLLTLPPDPVAFRERALATGQRIGVEGEDLAQTRDSIEIVSAGRALQITSLLATIANTLSSIGYQSYQVRKKLAQIAELSEAALAHHQE